MRVTRVELASTAAIVLLLLAVFASIGPAGCSRMVQTGFASGWGSDWLVVQYAQDGSVIASWELTGASVASETNSDGINFVDSSGAVVHLSGHYVYVQISDARQRKDALAKLLEGR